MAAKKVNWGVISCAHIANKAPLDAKRLKKDTPCKKLGKCIDCSHEKGSAMTLFSLRSNLLRIG